MLNNEFFMRLINNGKLSDEEKVVVDFHKKHDKEFHQLWVNHQLVEGLRKYYTNNLSGAEKGQFEFDWYFSQQRMDEIKKLRDKVLYELKKENEQLNDIGDSVFKAKIETDKTFATGFHDMYGGRSEVPDTIKAKTDSSLRVAPKSDVTINEHQTNNPVQILHTIKPARRLPILKKLMLVASVSLTFLFSGKILLNNIEANSQNSLFEKYYEPIALDLSANRASTNLLNEGISLFHIGEFEKAIQKLNEVEKLGQRSDEAKFLKGLLYIENDQVDVALEILNDPILLNSEFSDDAQWYSALCHIKNENFGFAKKILHKLDSQWKQENDYNSNHEKLEQVLKILN